MALSIACPDARDVISLISFIGKRLTLKGLSMDFIPDIPLPSFLLFFRVTCLW